MAVVAYTSNPYLTLLLELVLICAIAAKSGKKDLATITRSESEGIRADDRILGDLASEAQGKRNKGGSRRGSYMLKI